MSMNKVHGEVCRLFKVAGLLFLANVEFCICQNKSDHSQGFIASAGSQQTFKCWNAKCSNNKRRKTEWPLLFCMQVTMRKMCDSSEKSKTVLHTPKSMEAFPATRGHTSGFHRANYGNKRNQFIVQKSFQ